MAIYKARNVNMENHPASFASERVHLLVHLWPLNIFNTYCGYIACSLWMPGSYIKVIIFKKWPKKFIFLTRVYIICGHQRVAVTRHRVICIPLIMLFYHRHIYFIKMTNILYFHFQFYHHLSMPWNFWF